MKALSRIAAALTAMGASPADFNTLSRLGLHRRVVSKHAFNKTTRLQGLKSRCKLNIARGAGSISAKSDILQLARSGRFQMAYDMAVAHRHQCDEALFPQEVLDAWLREDLRSFAEDTAC